MIDYCYAKINLSLNITSRREDGFHLLESIMVPIKFYDFLEIKKADEMKYNCDKKYLKFDDKNTIVKMINVVKEEYGIKDNFEVNLKKIIPSQAGLAGGSSNAGGTLRILNKMYDLNLDYEKVRELCNKVGSDVLFTYYNKPALVSGIGDNLEFFEIKDKYYCLIAKPRKGVSTKAAYETLDLNKCDHPDVLSLKKALEEGKEINNYLGNSLEEPAFKLCPSIKELIDILKQEGGENIRMSGSGSAVFSISKDKEKIMMLYENMKKYHYLIRFSEFL